jgi:hypothetical protein
VDPRRAEPEERVEAKHAYRSDSWNVGEKR